MQAVSGGSPILHSQPSQETLPPQQPTQAEHDIGVERSLQAEPTGDGPVYLKKQQAKLERQKTEQQTGRTAATSGSAIGQATKTSTGHSPPYTGADLPGFVCHPGRHHVGHRFWGPSAQLRLHR